MCSSDAIQAGMINWNGKLERKTQGQPCATVKIETRYPSMLKIAQCENKLL